MQITLLMIKKNKICSDRKFCIHIFLIIVSINLISIGIKCGIKILKRGKKNIKKIQKKKFEQNMKMCSYRKYNKRANFHILLKLFFLEEKNFFFLHPFLKS